MVFSDKIEPLRVSVNDGHHRKATNTSKEMQRSHRMQCLSQKEVNISLLYIYFIGQCRLSGARMKYTFWKLDVFPSLGVRSE
jgi:hypothetical protein